MAAVTTDLFAFVAGGCREALTKAGYTVSAPDDEGIVFDYFRVLRRSIPTRPRSVHVAKTFVCTPDLRTAFDALCHKARIGGDLRPHQHRDRGNAAFDDGMLNDWDVHHLHLSTTVEADGFVTRSKPVLFARLTGDDFYCLTILPHGRGVKPPWSRQELVDILHDNWPASIEHAALKSPAGLQIVGVEQTHSDEDYARLRKAGINLLTQRADGTVHMPIGGGMSSSGINSLVVRECSRLQLQCRQVDDELKRQVNLLVAQGKCAAASLNFRWDVIDDHLVAIDESAGLRFDFGPATFIVVPLR